MFCKRLFIFLAIFGAIFHQSHLFCQSISSSVYIDQEGIMRYSESGTEVTGFGINYTVPFAHAYRMALRMGLDPKKIMEDDVHHFSRLGFDLFRVHVWDTEISDTLGNLLVNEHLDAFDYLISLLQAKNINAIITPIAFWGNGWPEPDQPTPGFSYKYGKAACLTDHTAIEAQENYLTQFMNHVNPYTGKTYKEDPAVLAIEVSNEPHHRGTPEEVTHFVRRMINAIRRSGSQQPVFYNVSHAVHLAEAYFEAGIQGGTFQWYPTGLGYRKELPGNYLPNVNQYHIPFDSIIRQYKGGKLVYEFDAADIGRSYIYPVMARSFREAGIQLATYFSYDPTFMAHFNTEYNTHYMNLAYTPQKALALMICGEIFKEVPLYESQGMYPENLHFYNTLVQYENDLAIFNAPEKFIHTNHTDIPPMDEKSLRLIAGTGSSTIIQYTGTGAYFLDKLEDHIWRIEIMPDVLWVQDPFGYNSPDKTVSVIQHNIHQLTLSLIEFNEGFDLWSMIHPEESRISSLDHSIKVKPGVYLITRKNIDSERRLKYQDIEKLRSFSAPASSVNVPYLVHYPWEEITEGQNLNIEVQCLVPGGNPKINVQGFTQDKNFSIPLHKGSGNKYSTEIPSHFITHGFLKYTLSVEYDENQFYTFPAGIHGKPGDWDFYDRTFYEVRIVPSDFPIILFDAEKDASELIRPWQGGVSVMPAKGAATAEYQITLEQLHMPDPENIHGPVINDYSIKHSVLSKIRGRNDDILNKSDLIIEGRSLNEQTTPVQIAIVLQDGSAYGAIVYLNSELQAHSIDLQDLFPVKTVILPRPYPTFLPYFFDYQPGLVWKPGSIESIQISIGPGLNDQMIGKKQSIAISRIWVQ
ncbi:MAG TPA: cellulase family glycosylhydrolase [Saprospiraceae bacterium]|nr:cellulase family glycosylhydrolase [Saprospiraceae bacterium]